MLRDIILRLLGLDCYVIADSTDNSVTFSRRLFRRLKVVMGLDVAKVLVFYVPESRCYAFTLNPSIEQETQLADIQYNSKHRCVGFESLVPTVNRIFYDYGLPSGIRCKLSVRRHTAPNGIVYYQICRPYGKYTR